MLNIQSFIDFINKSHSAFHATKNLADMLIEAGFTKLEESQKWDIKVGGKYFITPNSSSLMAFKIADEKAAFHIIGSHSDSPTFKIKPSPDIHNKNYVTLNTEPYGGAIYSTWFDRALSIAGRAFVKNETKIEQRLVDIDRDLLVISNPAIHLNREVNSENKLNAQDDIKPIIEMTEENLAQNTILKLLNQNLDSEVIDYELYLYVREQAKLTGINEEFLLSPKLDNLASAYASVNAIINSEFGTYNQFVAVFDNEEIGSSTKQGAGSPKLSNVLQRINFILGGDLEDFYTKIAKSFLISADGAHAYHPNYAKYNDITNFPVLNSGVTLKYSAKMSYTTDAHSAAYIKSICNENEIPYQSFVNRSDKAGGSTIGPITVKNLDINSVDLGISMLAMHSSMELCGQDDIKSLDKLFEIYLEQ